MSVDSTNKRVAPSAALPGPPHKKQKISLSHVSTDILNKLPKLSAVDDNTEEETLAKQRVTAARQVLIASLERSRVVTLKKVCVVEWDRGVDDTQPLRARVVQQRGKLLNSMGVFTSDSANFVDVVDAVFLVEQGAAVLQISGGVTATLQQVYQTMLDSGITLEHYRAYSHLKSMGYILISCRTLENYRQRSATLVYKNVMPETAPSSVKCRGWWPPVHETTFSAVIADQKPVQTSIAHIMNPSSRFHIDFCAYNPGTTKFRSESPHFFVSVCKF